jgi:hypothetical protein
MMLKISLPTSFFFFIQLFWRINRTIDFRIFMCEMEDLVIIRSFDSTENHEFPLIAMNLTKLMGHVSDIETAHQAHESSLHEITEHKRHSLHEKDETLKERRRQKDARRRKSLSNMTPAELEGVQLKLALEAETAQRASWRKVIAKIASFVINRFEAEKDKETGQIQTKLVPRPGENLVGLEQSGNNLDVALADIGSETVWNKKENVTALRRKSIEIGDATEAASVACQKAQETRKSLQVKFKFEMP